MFNHLKNLPEHPPLDWRSRADTFLEFVFNKENKVMHTLPNGHMHFTAFMEGSGQELITYGGIVIAKLLRGEDVQDLLPSLADYFSDSYGVYQNGVGDNRSEYWYLMHVNALAAVVTRLALMDDAQAVSRLKRSMDRLIQMAHQIDYDFNDQGYDFERGDVWTRLDAFRQPDSVGGYSYLMQFAYEVFEDSVYQQEARLAMERYVSFKTNPWYEIPNGAMACIAAAKLNADGANFPLEKVIDFALDSNEGSLHVGAWGGLEINGLMRGWKGHTRQEASSMAYSLETFVLLPYLLPVVRYDARFAKDIALYALHTTANARLFYSEFLPDGAEGRPDLTPFVPYEALHQQHGEHRPYASGDFHGQKSVYGGGVMAWWPQMIRPTSNPLVLELDITKTDFLSRTGDSVKMYYNPYLHDIDITIDVGVVPMNVVGEDDLILYKHRTGKISLHLDADSVTFLRFQSV